jgi:peptidoglycan/xylan/chitin deacetylase (PgdA/CDA1 family)
MVSATSKAWVAPRDPAPGTWDCICLTVDIDWAPDEALQEMRRLIESYGVRATFFCTHAGIEVPGHERALHPNFRRHGETLRTLQASAGPAFSNWQESEVYRGIIAATKAFCPEAVGVRAHSLFYDSLLLEVYQQAGMVYDSSYLLPLAPRLTPVLKEYDVLELPIWYNDQFDMKAQATGFHAYRLALDAPGLKVMNFHPNTFYINAVSHAHYLESRAFHKDPERLRAHRHPGRGVATLLTEVLEYIAAKRLRTAMLREVHDLWRKEAA